MGLTFANIGPTSGAHYYYVMLKDNGTMVPMYVRQRVDGNWGSWSQSSVFVVGRYEGRDVWAEACVYKAMTNGHTYKFEIYESAGSPLVEVSGSLKAFETKNSAFSVPNVWINSLFPKNMRIGGIQLTIFDQPRYGSSECSEMFANHTELTYFYGKALAGNCDSAQSFYKTFANTGIKSIPDDAFSAITPGGSGCFRGMFMDCKSLTDIGSNIVKNANVEGTCDAMFMNCTALTTVKAPFTKTVAVGKTGLNRLFKGCTALTALPDNFFESLNYPIGVSALQEAFQGCTALKTVGDIFPKPLALQDSSLAYMFQGCTALETIPGNLMKPDCQFNGNKLCLNHMFEGCTSLDLPDDFVLSNNTTSGGDGLQCYTSMFEGCTSITKLPAGTITMTTAGAQNCERMFAGCTGLLEIDKDAIQYTTVGESCFKQMFEGCVSLAAIPETLLRTPTLPKNACLEMFKDCIGIKEIHKDAFKDVITLSESCFASMFEGCAGLKNILKNLLADKVLAKSCFEKMFKDCTGLNTLPDSFLTQETLAESCCKEMFKDCIGITYLSGKPLPEADCAESCYESMFEGCANLKDVEKLELRPTAFAKNCCKRMFADCISLKKVRYSTLSPKQPDAEGCYEEMFSGCSSLNHVNVMFPLWGEQEPEDSVSNEAGPVTTTNWLAGVAPSGNFNSPRSLDVQYDSSHIPENWEYSYYVKATGRVYFMPDRFATYKGDINYDM